jgi:hypothetical protein
VLKIYSGCRRFSDDVNMKDNCHFDENAEYRPNTKTEAMSNGVVEGTIIGGAGAVTASQIGFFFFVFVYFVFMCIIFRLD